jgi:hypothetical protein
MAGIAERVARPSELTRPYRSVRRARCQKQAHRQEKSGQGILKPRPIRDEAGVSPARIEKEIAMHDCPTPSTTLPSIARQRVCHLTISVLALCAWSDGATAAAGGLRIVPTGSDIPTYVDTSTMVRKGNAVELVYVNDYRVASDQYNGEVRFRSEATRILMDCAKKTYAIMAVKGYSDRATGGTMTESRTVTGEEAKPSTIEADTILDHVLKFACSRKK